MIGSPSVVLPKGAAQTQAGVPISIPVSARSFAAIRSAFCVSSAGSSLRSGLSSSSPPATMRPCGVVRK